MRGDSGAPAHGDRGDRTLEISAAKMNVILPPDLDTWSSRTGDDDADDVPDLWPGSVIPVRLFRAAQTQWRVAAVPGALIWLGLDYVALDVIARALSIRLEDHFEAVLTMEHEALKVLNEVKG
jgi:Phage related hypothetical protein (DUF1799)